VAECTRAFTPTENELALAERALAELDAATRDGRGAIGSSGSMLDEASRRQAEAVLATVGRSST
jgi:citrate lyase beta subunit